MKAVILAAGVGKRLWEVTQHHPKCLIEIGGRSLLRRSLESLVSVGIRRAEIVVGYKQELIRTAVAQDACGVNVTFLVNEQFHRGSISSLWIARTAFDDDTIVMDADVLFHPEIHQGGHVGLKKSGRCFYDPASEMLAEPVLFLVQPRFFKMNTVKNIFTVQGCTIDHDAGSEVAAEYMLHPAGLYGYVGLLANLSQAIVIKIDTADHFVPVRGNAEFFFKSLAIKPEVLPLAINHGLKKAFAFFPKAPGAVIGLLGILVDQ